VWLLVAIRAHFLLAVGAYEHLAVFGDEFGVLAVRAVFKDAFDV